MDKIGIIKCMVVTGGLTLLVNCQAAPVFAKAEDSKSQATVAVDNGILSCIHKHVKNRLFVVIGASGDQKKELSQLLDNAMEENQQTRELLKQKVVSFVDDMADDNISDNQIRQQAKEIKSLRDQLIDSRLEVAIKARSIMTSNQKKVLSRRINLLLSLIWGLPHTG